MFAVSQSTKLWKVASGAAWHRSWHSWTDGLVLVKLQCKHCSHFVVYARCDNIILYVAYAAAMKWVNFLQSLTEASLCGQRGEKCLPNKSSVLAPSHPPFLKWNSSYNCKPGFLTFTYITRSCFSRIIRRLDFQILLTGWWNSVMLVPNFSLRARPDQ